MDIPCTGREKALVPFVEAGYQSGHEESNSRPHYRPARHSRYGNRDSPCSEKQDAHNGVADHVTRLPEIKMPVEELEWVQSEQEVKDGVKKPTGIFRGKGGRRFDHNEAKPQAGCEPGFPDGFGPRGFARDAQSSPISQVSTHGARLL